MTDDELMQRAGVDPERSVSLHDTARLLAAALDLSERTRHLVVMYKADPERPPGSRYHHRRTGRGWHEDVPPRR
jgi:hypothetical protein